MSLIGWSLGGVIAREVARELPDQIEQVITYGTPVLGGPSYTRGAAFFGVEECARIRRLVDEAQATDPIQVPLSIVFGKQDAVVSWPACVDAASPNARHFEVTTSHVGLGLDPDVWCLCAQRLADR